MIVCDFQRMQENSPGADLATFLSSNIADPEAQKGNMREMLSTYYDELVLRGVDTVDYPWHRMLAEVSLGFAFEAFSQLSCVENIFNLAHEIGRGTNAASTETSFEQSSEFESENIFVCSPHVSGVLLPSSLHGNRHNSWN